MPVDKSSQRLGALKWPLLAIMMVVQLHMTFLPSTYFGGVIMVGMKAIGLTAQVKGITEKRGGAGGFSLLLLFLSISCEC
jgi:hypothetical protein